MKGEVKVNEIEKSNIRSGSKEGGRIRVGRNRQMEKRAECGNSEELISGQVDEGK